MARQFRIGEFAALTGVSIRTLHHYDRIGLLRPSARSDAGYRLYAECDLLRLQQILTLRYLGFQLVQIDELLRQDDFNLLGSIRLQRRALRERIDQLERIDAELEELLTRRTASGAWDWELLARASAVVQQSLNQKGAKMKPFDTPEEIQREFQAAASEMPPGEIERIEEAWPPLLAEIRANYDLEPSSPEARELLSRWETLQAATMRGFQNRPQLTEWIAEGYQTGRYAEIDGAPRPEDFAFIERVKAARDSSNVS